MNQLGAMGFSPQMVSEEGLWVIGNSCELNAFWIFMGQTWSYYGHIIGTRLVA